MSFEVDEGKTALLLTFKPLHYSPIVSRLLRASRIADTISAALQSPPKKGLYLTHTTFWGQSRLQSLRFLRSNGEDSR